MTCDTKCIVPNAIGTTPMLYSNALFVLNIQLYKNMANFGYSIMRSFMPSGDSLEYDDQ